MWKFFKYWLWDIDKAPDKIGIPGLVIMGVFLLFCVGALIYHDVMVR